MAYCGKCGKQLPEGANFCLNCGTQVKTTTSEKRQTIFEGQVHKCPHCGEVINAFEINCPACGMEFRGTAVTNSVKELSRKLEEINNEKKNKGLLESFLGGAFISSNTEKQVSLINNFTIPNTREDLWEFLILSSANIQPSELSSMQDKSQKAISGAWKAKFNQAYQKAKLLFQNDPEFKKIEELYNTKNSEIMKAKRKEFLKYGLIILLFIFIFIFSLGLLSISSDKSSNNRNKIKEENERLESIVTEVYGYIEEENYTMARAKAATIVFRFSSDVKSSDEDKAAEQWDATRETLLEIIDSAENGEDYSKIE